MQDPNAGVPVDCRRCGAGYSLPQGQAGYVCTSCGGSVIFRSCPSCDQVAQIEGQQQSFHCSHCGRTVYTHMGREALAAELPAGSASFRPGARVDPLQRVVAGVVTAASSIVGLMPGSPCIIVFSWDYIGVQTASGETDRIPYSEVNSLNVSGQGTRVFTRNAGIVGGGFGVKGALEGMALARLANAATTRTTTIRDTVVNFRAGQRAILMRSETFEPDALRIILSPVHHRMEQVARAGASPATSGSTPAGWYPDPAGGSSKRYWDGSRWN